LDTLSLVLAAHIGLVLIALAAVHHGADSRDGFTR
jgi:hypothetical protein